MDGVVTFDYITWVLRYPELATVAQPLAQMFFGEATLYCNNTPTSPIRDVNQRAPLLNMVTAHIAALNGQPSSPLVGRINSASEGSVSVQTQMEFPPGSAQWFNQTKYGAAFWQATVQFRTMRYVANPARPTDPFALRRGR